MSVNKNDFYAKDVTGAIKNACDHFGVPQEKLEIEVLETGSTGIFGLIRKKAHISVVLKPEIEEVSTEIFDVETYLNTESVEAVEPEEDIAPQKTAPKEVSPVEEPPAGKEDVGEKTIKEKEPAAEVSPESLEIIRAELLQLVELMGFPSSLDIETAGLSVSCTLRGDFEENLTGPDGKVLDSLQYILRKIVSRKVVERLRISINIGEFREKRLEDLKTQAVEMAALVKEDGKTQVLPALNPSERRVIHMILQEDKEIRSRSVGDGLFKKILIYKPGKGNRSNGRKRTQSKGRQNKSRSKKSSDS